MQLAISDDRLPRHFKAMSMYVCGVITIFHVNIDIKYTKCNIFLLGNRQLLSTCDVWSELFQHYQKHRAITSPDGFIKRI